MKKITILLSFLLSIGTLCAQVQYVARYPNQKPVSIDSLVGDSIYTWFMDEKGVVLWREARGANLVSPDALMLVQEAPKPLNMKEVAGAIGYPDSLIQAGIQGAVVLRMLVLADGSIGGIKVAKAGHDALLKLIIPHMHRITFSPALQNGTPIAYWANVPFLFVPASARGTSGRPEPRAPKKAGKRPR